MVYVATLSESQRVMRWRLILKYFGPNTQQVDGVDKIVAAALNILPSKPSNKFKPCTMKSQCCAKEIFVIGGVENNEGFFPLNVLIVQREQPK